MAPEPPAGPPGGPPEVPSDPRAAAAPRTVDERGETALLRAEVAQQREDSATQKAREQRTDELKGRVSIAAIVLTTALSFIGTVRGTEQGVIDGAKEAAESARRQSAELWAYYQTKLAERTSLELADDRLRLDLRKRGLSRDDPSVRLEARKLDEYERRLGDFDSDTQQVFYRVQELEALEDVKLREKIEPAAAVFRYDLATKLITLALILLSVAILSSKRWLFWAGVALGSIGLLLALDGYFLLL